MMWPCLCYHCLVFNPFSLGTNFRLDSARHTYETMPQKHSACCRRLKASLPDLVLPG